ncbi:MAG: hypothetical protein ACTHK7_04410 [Aureliella sp.]
MNRNLFQSVGELLQSWWKVDRIRVATSTGRTFQLVPGDRLLIGEHLLMVRKRSVLLNPAKRDTGEEAALGVEYRLIDLAESDGEATAGKVFCSTDDEWRMQILLPNDSQPSVYRLWIRGVEQELLEEEIVVLG